MVFKKERTIKISQFVKLDKKYEAEIMLGAKSNTYDRTGIIIKKKSNTLLTKVSPKKKILIDPISILDIKRYKNIKDGIFFLEAYYENNSGCWIKGF